MPPEDDTMKQAPNKVEVGYWSNRSKKFNSELKKGFDSARKETKQPTSPAKPKESNKQEAKGDETDKGS